VNDEIYQDYDPDRFEHGVVNRSFVEGESASKEREVLGETENDELGVGRKGVHGEEYKVNDLDA